MISVVLIIFAAGRKNIKNPDWTLFLLGASFLLLETKSVTEMSLLFGSTWQVNVLVFSAILVRVVSQERPLGVFEWALFFIGPLFIAAALWRLARTS